MTTYIIIAIIVLLGIIAAIFIRRRGPGKITPLSSLALALVVAGIVFGDNRVVGYSLMGAGVLLAIYDSVRNRNTRNRTI